VSHVFGDVGSLAIGAVLGFGLGHWRGAALQAGGGIVITELQIFTQPTGAVDALARYRRGHIDEHGVSAVIVPALAPLAVTPLPGSTERPIGLALQAVF
jgi:hypothetical protein